MKNLFLIVLIVSLTLISCAKEDLNNEILDINKLEINKSVNNNNYQITKEISYGSSPEQTFDIYSPKITSTAKSKVIVLIHGGSWMNGDKSSLEGLLTRIQNTNPNYTIVNMNYVLANDSTFAFPNQFMDIDLVLNELTNNQDEYRIIPEFALVGKSAGGHLALIYDNSFDKLDRVKTVCSISGPTDFTHSAFQDDPNFDYLFDILFDEIYYSYTNKIIKEVSPVYKISKRSSPTIIFHGIYDIKVPIENAELLEEKLRINHIPNKLLIFNEGHSNWNNNTMQIFDLELKLFLDNNF